MMQGFPILSVLTFLPIFAGLALLRMAESHAQKIALAISIAVLALSLFAWGQFNAGTAAMQFVERVAWIESFGIDYHLGIDGFSLPLILLTALITILIVLASGQSVTKHIRGYLSLFLILEGLMIGVFSALDAILFYLFWEAMLIPMFLLIGIWGGPRRVYATIKFFLFTFFGSVFMLVALLYLYRQAGSFYILDLHTVPLSLDAQKWIFWAFLLAFAVKIPMWPVHTWLPDAHVEAPTGGSVVLAAIMLKMGGYGFLRFSLPIAPDASLYFSDFMIVLSLIAIVYVGLVALAQTDMKKLIAYSSISHMGFVTLGFFLGFSIFKNTYSIDGGIMALEGGIMQMISHGFISAALFLCVGVLYDRMHSREISSYGGVVNVMPRFAALMMLFAMANCGLPGTSGFVGEFFVILASFQASFWIAFLAALTLILGAAYTLWMYKRVIFGAVANEKVAQLSDLSLRETWVLGILAAMILLFGVWPAPILDMLHASSGNLLQHLLQGKL
ncbi:MAG: NADH-quinone oxidoreductase subunit M [Candidatus Eutrophobiaceae bacterium]